MKWVYNDGGRAAAGFSGNAGDCVCRAIAIAMDRPYETVYAELSAINTKTITKGVRGKKSARNGIKVKAKAFKDYMAAHGWRWVPTMHIGTGCKVHLHDGELPQGRLIVSVSKHYTTVIDGVIHDTHDPQRETHATRLLSMGPLLPHEFTRDGKFAHSIQRRCVYGYWVQA